MTCYVWSGLPAHSLDSITTQRMMNEAATMLGVAFPTDATRDALIAELAAQANLYTYTEVATLLNQVRQVLLYQPLGNPAFAIDTNFDVKNATAIAYTNGGTLKSLGANTSFDTGTTATIAGSKYGVAVLSVSASATATVTWFTASGAGYASEAAAIAAISGLSATATYLGYATVQAHASGFTAGSDALATGSGGNPALATTYYNTMNPNGLLLGAAVS